MDGLIQIWQMGSVIFKESLTANVIDDRLPHEHFGDACKDTKAWQLPSNLKEEGCQNGGRRLVDDSGIGPYGKVNLFGALRF